MQTVLLQYLPIIRTNHTESATMSASFEVNQEPQLHIYNLPVEIFDHIVNFLPMRDRKSIALVSRSWYQQAGGHLKLRINCNGVIAEARDVSVLRESVRPFRHLVLNYLNLRPRNGLSIATVLDILRTVGPGIESLTLMVNDADPADHLREFVSRMPNLKQLTVNIADRNDHGVEPEQAVELIKRCELKLRCLALFALNKRVPIDQLNLPQLQTLKLWNVNCIRDEALLCRFFKNLPVLRTAFLHFKVTSAVLKVICDNCPLLSQLGFNTDGLSGKSYQYFEKLENLRVLLVDGPIRRDLLDKCKPLKSVDFISISKKTEASMQQLSWVFPKLRKLQVNRYGAMQLNNELVQDIYRNFKQLQCLVIDTIDDCAVRSGDPVSPEVFNQVIGLTNLQELTLSCMCTSSIKEDHDCLLYHFVQACRHPLPSNLKRLKLKNCNWIEVDALVHTVQLLPGLQYLEVSGCGLITRQDMKITREVMPKCAIHFVRHRNPYCPDQMMALRFRLFRVEPMV